MIGADQVGDRHSRDGDFGPDVQREQRCQQASDAEASDSRNGSGRRRHE